MPTSIPVYRFGSKAKDEFADGAQALFNFYGAAAIAVLLLLVLEKYFGLFDGMSAAQALLTATGAPLAPDASIAIP